MNEPLTAEGSPTFQRLMSMTKDLKWLAGRLAVAEKLAEALRSMNKLSHIQGARLVASEVLREWDALK